MLALCHTESNDTQGGIIAGSPWDAEGIEWDDDIVEHLAHHQVSIPDVHEAVVNAVFWFPNLKYGADRWRLLSFNDAGRPLTLIFAYDEVRRWLRPITGRTSTEPEVNKYLK
jgi:uncharacterized DUF497 family protein